MNPGLHFFGRFKPSESKLTEPNTEPQMLSRAGHNHLTRDAKTEASSEIFKVLWYLWQLKSYYNQSQKIILTVLHLQWGLHGTEVAFALLTQLPRVWIPCQLNPILVVLKGFRVCSEGLKSVLLKNVASVEHDVELTCLLMPNCLTLLLSHCTVIHWPTENGIGIIKGKGKEQDNETIWNSKFVPIACWPFGTDKDPVHTLILIKLIQLILIKLIQQIHWSVSHGI